MKCKVCGATISENQKFCSQCGSKIELSKSCAKCGYIFQDTNVKFCPECGTKVDDEYESTESLENLVKSTRSDRNILLDRLLTENPQLINDLKIAEIFDYLSCSKNDLDCWQIIKHYLCNEKQIEISTLKLREILDEFSSIKSEPLSLNYINNNSDYIKELILSGADSSIRINEYSTVDDTLLNALCQHDLIRTEIISVLIKGGNKINAINNAGYTALHLACKYNQSPHAPDIIEELINAGANVNKRVEGQTDSEENGKTALHLVCIYNNTHQAIEIIEKLINAGADVNIKDYQGSTPLLYQVLYAQTKEGKRIFNFLRSKGAKG